MKPLYDLLIHNIKFKWNKKLETLFKQVQTSITEDVTLTLPNTNYPFFFTVDSYLIGMGYVLLQMIDTQKLDIIA